MKFFLNADFTSANEAPNILIKLYLVVPCIVTLVLHISYIGTYYCDVLYSFSRVVDRPKQH